MSQIKTNTAALQDILDAASNLPKPLDTSDATATSSKIFNGYTAYVNDKMIAGTFSLDNELSTQDSLITQIQEALQNKASTPTEDLDEELTTQENLIAELQEVLNTKASGGSGGGDVKTCTVTITSEPLASYMFTVFENGAITSYPKEGEMDIGATYITLDNVVCGSGFMANPVLDIIGTTITGGATIIYKGAIMSGVYFRAPDIAGANVIIDIYDAD